MSLFSKTKNLYANTALGVFDALIRKSGKAQLKAFDDAINSVATSSAIAANPAIATEKIFGTIEHLDEDNRLPAFETTLSKNGIRQSLEVTIYRAENVFVTAYSLPKQDRLQGFKAAMNALEGKQKNFFPRWSTPHIFCLIGMMPEEYRAAGFSIALESPAMHRFLQEIEQESGYNPHNTEALARLLTSIIDYLPDDYFLDTAINNDNIRRTLRSHPTSIFAAVEKAHNNKAKSLQLMLQNQEVIESFGLEKDYEKDRLVSEFKKIIDTRYAGEPERVDDNTRIALAKVFIGAIQKQVAQEVQDAAAYVTPLLDLEGTLVATFGQSLSNEARKYRSQDPISFSDISQQFNQAQLGWELRPVNSVDDQVKFNHVLPDNDNLFTRVVKRMKNQEVHAVIGNKTGKINISIEPART